MQNPDFRRAPLADLDKYGEKTSEHGHYELASQYKSGKSHFRWVEDNRKFEAPAQEEQAPPAEEPGNAAPIQLSNRAAAADAGTAAYEDVLLNKQGTTTIGNDDRPEQAFKNMYQNNLINELKAKDPATMASKMAEIEIADKQKASMEDSFSLDLGSNPLTQGKQAGSNLTFS